MQEGNALASIYYQKDSVLPPKTRYVFHPVGNYGKFSDMLFDEYPFAKQMYEDICEDGVGPGTVQIVKCRDVVILNAFVYWHGQLSFDALNSCLEDIDYTIYGKSIGFCKHFFPTRDWNAIEGLIESRIETMNPIVYY